MRADILQHKFIEFGKHRSTTESGKVVQHFLGIKSASVAEVFNDGFPRCAPQRRLLNSYKWL